MGRDASSRLSDQLSQNGTSRQEALALFDNLPGPALEDMLGGWRGLPLHTGHPLDGLLEAHGWRGKAFRTADDVAPLLFDLGARTVTLDPRWIQLRPLAWPWLRSRAATMAFRAAAPLLATQKPTARLRHLIYRGRAGAAMIYDRQPIIDVFRTLGPDHRLGLMDARGFPPFFFLLEREGASPPPQDRRRLAGNYPDPGKGFAR